MRSVPKNALTAMRLTALRLTAALLTAALLTGQTARSETAPDGAAAPRADVAGGTATDPLQLKAWTAAAFAAYEQGRTEAAQVLYLRAARGGDAAAAYNAAVIRINGESRHPLLGEALVLLRSSAAAGFVDAQLMIASLHEQGLHLPASAAMAMVWLRRAADGGSIAAQLALGTRYFLGRDVAPDETEAARWYGKAADAGDVGAQYILASMYEKGIGVAADLDQALAWYGAAARQGDIAAALKAKEVVERLAAQSRPTDR